MSACSTIGSYEWASTRHSPHHICRILPLLSCPLQDPRKRADANRVLQHEWMRENGTASERPLDNVILKRMRGFAAMNKLKKEALKVIAAGMTSEEIAGLRSMFQVGSQPWDLKLLAKGPGGVACCSFEPELHAEQVMYSHSSRKCPKQV